MPFRFLAAYREVLALDSGAVAPVLAALETAFEASARNLRGFDAATRVVVACDVSGSMQKPVLAHGVALIAGWSDKVFDGLAALENGGSEPVEIQKIEL